MNDAVGILRIGPYYIPLELGQKFLDKLRADKNSQRAWLIDQIEKYVEGK